MSRADRMTDDGSVIELDDVVVEFKVASKGRKRGESRVVKAVDQVSLQIRPGECYGLVGESGCGKSTLANVMVGLQKPTSGAVRRRHGIGRTAAAAVQMVFQDPQSSLNPKMRVDAIVAEPLGVVRPRIAPAAVTRRVDEVLEMVGLPPGTGRKYPHQFSGGQRQRIAIARALAVDPSLLVLDEPTSGLDVSVRALILNLLSDLRARLDLTYVYISHDLASVAYMADRIGVMYLGRLVEEGTREITFDGTAEHPYTRMLLDAVPTMESVLELSTDVDEIDVPTAMSLPPGCRFNPRCLRRIELGAPASCGEVEPNLIQLGATGRVACHFPTSGAELRVVDSVS